MSNLPKIQKYPTKKIKLPVSKKEVKIRPFLVKEEKILIMVKEDENSTSEDVLNAIEEVVDSCTLGSLSVRELTQADLEYLFIRIRMISKGEKSRFRFRCNAVIDVDTGEKCPAEIPVEADLREVELFTPEGHKKLFRVPGTDFHISMRYPTIEDAVKLQDEGINLESTGNMKWKDIERLVGMSVEMIIEGDENDNVPYTEFTVEEVIEWMEGVPGEVLKEIVQNFFSKMPYIRFYKKIKCPECGTERELEVRGMENFFG